MSRLILEPDEDLPLRILCLGAHCDDVELGCGGTILRLIQERKRVLCDWVVFSSTPERAEESRESAEKFLHGADETNVVIKDIRDGFFPAHWAETKEFFEEEIRHWGSPHLIFTHYRQDLHQDHRVISDLTWNTFRDHLILEYESPKYDGDLGTPNFFVGLNRSICERKIQTILECYKSQAEKKWFTDETFWAMLRLRGIEAYSSVEYAEAYYCRKAVL